MGHASSSLVADSSKTRARKVENGHENVELVIPDERKRQSLSMKAFHLESPIRMQLSKNSSAKEENAKIKVLEIEVEKLKANRDCLHAEKNRLVTLIQKLQQELHDTKLDRNSCQRTVQALVNEVSSLKLQLRLSRTRLVHQYPDTRNPADESATGSCEELPASNVDSSTSSNDTLVNNTAHASNSAVNETETVNNLGPVIRIVALVGHDLLNSAEEAMNDMIRTVKPIVQDSNRLLDYDVISVNALKACPKDVCGSTILVAFPGSLNNMHRSVCDWLNESIFESNACVKAILIKTTNIHNRLSRREEALWLRVSQSKRCSTIVLKNGEDVCNCITNKIVPFLETGLEREKVDVQNLRENDACKSLPALVAKLAGLQYSNHESSSVIQEQILHNILNACVPWIERKELGEIRSSLCSVSEPNALLVCHEHGTGASTLVAKIIKQNLQEGKGTVLYHFVESDSRSLLSDSRIMMLRFAKLLGSNEDEPFLVALGKAAQLHENILVVIDGIDKMIANYQGVIPEWLRWIISPMPANCSLLLTCHDVPQDLKHVRQMDIGVLSDSEMDNFLEQLLDGREHLLRLIRHKMTVPSLKNALVAKAVVKYLGSLSLFKVESELESVLSSDASCLSVVTHLLTKVPHCFGSMSYDDIQIVWKVLGLISSSRDGLSRIELESIEPKVGGLWNKIIPTLVTYSGGVLETVAGLYRFTSALWRQALDDLIDCTVLNNQLVTYWTAPHMSTTWRSVDECAYVLSHNCAQYAAYLLRPQLFMSLYARNYISQIHMQWAATQHAQPYLHALLKENGSSYDAVFLLSCCVFAAEEGPLDDTALVLSHSAVERVQSFCGMDSVTSCMAVYCCALLHYTLHSYMPAEKYCKRALQIASQILGSDHTVAQCILLLMVHIFSAQKKMKSAENVHNRLVEICTRNGNPVLNLSNASTQYSLRKALQIIMDTHRVVPMRLYATWETERIATNCVPRTCTVQLSRLTVLKPEPDISCLVIAVKLQGFKRTLRSNDLPVVPQNGIIDIDLDISFTLQYPHAVKRRGNNLQILLQRRKKYKNRPIPGGFKTLAVGIINLTDVLQTALDRELCLYKPDEHGLKEIESFSKDMEMARNLPPPSGPPAAKLFMISCSSQAMENDENRNKERDLVADLYSDEDGDEDSTNEEGGSDSEPVNTHNDGAHGSRRVKQMKTTPQSRFIGNVHARNKNLKQKFVALLKKFKISEEALQVAESTAVPPTEQELQALFAELEDMSDSGGEGVQDDLSVRSTPKPSLRPYFASSKEQLAFFGKVSPIAKMDAKRKMNQSGDMHSEESLDSEMSQPDVAESDSPNVSGDKLMYSHKDTPKLEAPTTPLLKQGSAPGNELKKRLISSQTRTVSDLTSERPPVKPKVDLLSNRIQTCLTAPLISEQISLVMPNEDKLPDSLCLVSANDVFCQNLCLSLSDRQIRLLFVTSFNDVKSVLTALVTRIQKFCNTNAVSPHTLSITLMGGDKLVSWALKSFAESFAQKPSEWQHYVKFTVIAPVASCVSRCLAMSDPNYSGQFCDALWKEFWEKTDINEYEIAEITSRICKYTLQARMFAPLPIAEAMLQLWDKSSPEGSQQVFVPFLMEVRLGSDTELSDTSIISPPINVNTSLNVSCTQSTQGSPPGSKTLSVEPSGHTSPPASPNLTHSTQSPSQSVSMTSIISDATGLQIEYWPIFVAKQTGIQGGGEGGNKRMASVSDPTVPSQTQLTSPPSINQPSKSSCKAVCKSLVINRQPTIGAEGTPCLGFQFVKDRKKESVLKKLGMKNKEKQEMSPVQTVDNVSRLICSSKHSTFKVYIDGIEWSNVKYFQISSAWQTQVKQFPLNLYMGEPS